METTRRGGECLQDLPWKNWQALWLADRRQDKSREQGRAELHLEGLNQDIHSTYVRLDTGVRESS